MGAEKLISLFLNQAKETSFLEWAGIVTGVAEVLLARANKVLLYPAGIISTLIYTYLFIRPSTKLYADAILNMYYFVMSVYGWILWTRKIQGTPLAITRANKKAWGTIILFCIGGWAALYLMLTSLFPMLFSWYTVSDMAALDAFISATAWVGMWLLARRKVENWLLLNLSNIVAIPVYFYKGMPFTAGLTLFLFIVAIFGYLEWERQFKQQESIA